MDYNLLKKLCLAFGPSGYEREVRNIIIEEIKDYADNYYIDNVGNVIAFKKGKNRAGKKIVYAAHMDEVGFMITASEKDGYAKFRPIGIMSEVSLNKRVEILPYVAENMIEEKKVEKITAVIGAKPIHLLNGDERKRARPFDKMYFDYGVIKKDDKDKKENKDNTENKDKDKKDEEKLINVGDYAVFYGEYYEFGENNIKISAKAIDDRFGCTVLCDMIKSELEYDTYFSFTVCEEIGLRGAIAAANQIQADVAIIIEATTANDLYDPEKITSVLCNQGKGAVISIADNRTLYDKKLVDLALDTAKENNINVQIKKGVAGGNESGAYQRAGSGAKVLAISLPARYIHSANVVGDKRDMEDCFNLAKSMNNVINTKYL